MQLTERVALITGAGSGIGKAAAHLLAKEGAKIAALGETEEEVAETVSKIHNNGGEAITLIADISQPEPMQKAIQQIVDKWDRIDIVFANAGINGVWAPIEELQPEVGLMGHNLCYKVSLIKVSCCAEAQQLTFMGNVKL